MHLFASVDDLEARLSGPFVDEADRARAKALLEDATAVMLERLDWPEIPDGCKIPSILRTTCLSIALRVYNNPMGITSESMGDYSYRRAANSVAGMSLLPQEIEVLEKYRRKSPIVSARVRYEIEDWDRVIWGPLSWKGRRNYLR
ncbi:hypothetical protein O1L55_20695 [Streptomyces albulus]|nr:hypothetical protein [Streptomyces noursei]